MICYSSYFEHRVNMTTMQSTNVISTNMIDLAYLSLKRKDIPPQRALDASPRDSGHQCSQSPSPPLRGLMFKNIPRHSMGLPYMIIYAAPLTPLAPPQLIGKYSSPMECLGYNICSCQRTWSPATFEFAVCRALLRFASICVAR